MFDEFRCAKSSRRGFLVGAGSVATAAAFGGIPRLAMGQSSGETLRAGITGFNVVNTLDPAKASLLSEFYVIWASFNSLLKYDAEMNIIPDLAESFQPVDGGFEFVLRQNVRFHDGSEMTAEDVKFTIERLQDAATQSPNRGRFTNIREIRIIDPYRLQILADSSLATLLSSLTNTRTGSQIVSKRAYEALGAEAFERSPVGTGAYVIKDWLPNDAIRLEAHGQYFVSGKPTIKHVSMPLIPEESSGMRAVLGGQLDLTSTAPFSDVQTLENQGNVQLFRSAGLNNRYLTLNVRQKPFDDVHFRRAVSMAIDRDVLVKAVLFGEGAPSGSLLPPALTNMKGLPDLAQHNVERARAELAKSKYGAGTEVTLLGWGSAWWKRFAEIVAVQVSSTLDINCRVEIYDSNTVYSRLKAGDYEAAVWGWLGLTDPHEYLGEAVGSGQWRNFQGYENPELDELLQVAENTVDPEERKGVYAQIEVMVLEDMPVIPCFVSNIHNLASTHLQGFQQLPYSNYGDAFQNLRLG